MERFILSSNDYEKDTLNYIVDEMVKEYRNSGKDEILFCGIGTDKAIFDSVGCLTGSLLNESNKLKKIDIYGTLESPIHALNIKSTLRSIRKKHNNPFIIGVDAALAYDDKSQFKDIVYRKKPISAGKGAGKELPSVGDVSLIGIISDNQYCFDSLINSVRLFDVMSMSKVISEIIINFEERLGIN